MRSAAPTAGRAAARPSRCRDRRCATRADLRSSTAASAASTTVSVSGRGSSVSALSATAGPRIPCARRCAPPVRGRAVVPRAPRRRRASSARRAARRGLGARARHGRDRARGRRARARRARACRDRGSRNSRARCRRAASTERAALGHRTSRRRRHCAAPSAASSSAWCSVTSASMISPSASPSITCGSL